MNKNIKYIKLNDINIPINIKSYKKSKTIKIYFKDGILTITKPTYVSKYKIYKILEEDKEDICIKYIKVLSENKNKKEWYEKESIYYMGKEYKIIYDYDIENKIKLIIDEDKEIFKVQVPSVLSKEDKKYYLDKGLKELFKRKTKYILDQKLKIWSNKMNLEYKSFKVRDAISKYGSCKPKTKELYFTLRLIMLPENVIDAIIVHELAHIVYANHSKDFYSLIEKYIPDYKKIDKWLKKNGNFIML